MLFFRFRLIWWVLWYLAYKLFITLKGCINQNNVFPITNFKFFNNSVNFTNFSMGQSAFESAFGLVFENNINSMLISVKIRARALSHTLTIFLFLRWRKKNFMFIMATISKLNDQHSIIIYPTYYHSPIFYLNCRIVI